MAKNNTRHTIDVLAEDIANGDRGRSSTCAVVKSVERIIPGASHVLVDTQSIRFTINGVRYMYMTPSIVQQYVTDFDAGDPIEPFWFKLHNPVRIKRKVFTEEGKERNRADSAKRYRARAAQKKSSAVKSNPEPAESPTLPKEGTSSTASEGTSSTAPKVRAPSGTYSTWEPPGPSTPQLRPPMPRVFRTGRREYGARVLRINRDRFKETAPAQ